MVLDSISRNMFSRPRLVFKNTYKNNKKVKVAVDADDAPEEFFFVHIKFTPTEETLKRIEALPFASLLQNSCLMFIRQCHEKGLISEKKKDELEKYIMKEKVTKELRCLLGTVLSPNLQETISKVR